MKTSPKDKERKEEKAKWLRLDGDGGWQIVIPESDIKPHAVKAISKRKMELAWLDCPCKPKIDYMGKIIVHSSFEEMKKVEEAIINPKIL